ncbi:acyl-CoA carboxylase epsilon subunit [Cellulomonas sp. PhB143]|uniref:acyl-CoA carboxylase epsilon subunit n=1 Tax=Cellulomonas sp. PhB143 TaxID=2485186 RepID=UPI000F47A4F3|nr:acyl-CoA carboxylase epsilon subunit [Cellulomonas sp. PhB143]ROS76975.1 acyl-CoA carboxylase epsilon subunit-like protein [Cellulomonas sp. PhB143]
MSEPAHLRIVRGSPDEIEVAALVAGLSAALAAGDAPADAAPVEEWTNRARGLRGTGGGATARSFGGRAGRHNADAWRWSLRS